MTTKLKFVILILMFLSVGIAAISYLCLGEIAVLAPKGWIGEKQRDLLVLATALMLIIVIPVLLLTFGIAWKYRKEAKAKHTPNWDHSFLAECVWWGVPCAIMLALGYYTWKGCHELDPFKPIAAKKEMQIQVIALRWKWLFLYPEEHIASVNYLRFPQETSIHFEITADAPMNSFWIPQLGGQIYAMSGMRSELYLIANGPGKYRGSSANISGKGFASMKFIAESSSDEDFAAWVQSVKGAPALDYERLTSPSEYNPPAFYVWEDTNLFHRIINKYMMP
ncbi:MAG TPA: COX aromatic rich motif-containing protein [Chlamydiales bacterium]|nr:COX aromatic rich motif-containing protein [Chlamydiales bacterium]